MQFPGRRRNRHSEKNVAKKIKPKILLFGCSSETSVFTNFQKTLAII